MNSIDLFAPIYLTNGLNSKRIRLGKEDQSKCDFKCDSKCDFKCDIAVTELKSKKIKRISYKDKRPFPIDTDLLEGESNRIANQVCSTFAETKRIGLWITEGIIDSHNSCNDSSSFIIQVSAQIRAMSLAEGLRRNKPMSWVNELYKHNIEKRSIFDQLSTADIDEIKRRMRRVEEKIRQRNLRMQYDAECEETKNMEAETK